MCRVQLWNPDGLVIPFTKCNKTMDSQAQGIHRLKMNWFMDPDTELSKTY